MQNQEREHYLVHMMLQSGGIPQESMLKEIAKNKEEARRKMLN